MRFLTEESDYGNVEYKLTLLHKDQDTDRLEELASQMRFRLYEGQGEALYYIGVNDDGVPVGLPPEELDNSVNVLRMVADRAKAKVRILRQNEGNDGLVAEVLVLSEKNPSELPVDIRIATVGNVDSGKSTLLGVLLKGDLDDGRGSARARVFRYLHELESGRTSSISTRVIGFDEDGRIVNQDKVHPPTDIELLERSIKTISFHDLAGHERYLKTTIYGLTGLIPDYAMLMVSANQGVLQMTKEHLGLVIALKIPFFVVISKIDLTPEERKNRTLDELKKLLKIPGVSKVPLNVKSIDDAIVAALNISRKSVVPIFELSAVEGTGLEELVQFLQLLLTNRRVESISDGEFRAYVDDIFHVPGVGTVVAAMVYSGSLKNNETIHLGPFDDGSFKEVRIKSIHYKRVPTDQVVEGQNATFALAKFKKDDVRKGMVLLSTKHGSSSIYEFEAEIYVLYHSTTIKKGYTPVIHCRSIRQSAQMVDIDHDVIRTGDRAQVHFKFMYRPEHIREGQRIVFREGRTKGIGIVSKIYPPEHPNN